MAYKRVSPQPVVEGGTGLQTITDHGVMVGSGTAAVTPLAVGTDGQLVMGATGADPAFATLGSTLSTIDRTTGVNSLSVDVNAGFRTVTGWATFTGAAPYFDDTTLGTFQLLSGGTGYINGMPVSFAAQNITGLTAGNTYYIYIDSTGTIQKTAVYSDSLYQDNVVLFECLRDSTPVTNNQITVKENHPYNFQPSVSNYCHEVIGTVIENIQNGANIVLNGTQKIQINGADVLQDHGLTTTIPDSSGVGVTFRKMYTDGTGKWATFSVTDTFTGNYNNAGTPTALGANRFGVYRLYVSKDTLNTTTPSYIAVLHTAQFLTQVGADNAIAAGTIAQASNELAQLELAQLGYIVYSQAANAIVEVVISKSTLRSTLSTAGTNVASLVNTNVTNFNNVLSSADTTVQAALDTIDDFGSGTGTQTVHLYDGAGIKTVTLGSTNTTSATTVQAGSTGMNITTATANGPLTVRSGTGAINIADDATNNTVNIATGAGVKSVTVGSGNTTSSTTVACGTGGASFGATANAHTTTLGSTSGASLFTLQGGSGASGITTANGSLGITSGTGTINLSADATNTTVNLATGAGVKVLTVGSITSTSSTTLRGGSNGLVITTLAQNGFITLTSGTGTISIGAENFNSTINVGVGLGSSVKTCNFGSSISSSTTTLQSGSGALNVTSANGAMTLNSGTGTLGLSTDASATTVNLATGSAAKAVTLGSTNTTSTTTINYGTGGYFLASATGNVMTALSSGECNYPLQPAFLAVLANTISNVTGDNTTYTIVFDTEIFDQNSDFDGSTTFTAPVTGRYCFSNEVTVGDLSTSFADGYAQLVTSNRSYVLFRIKPGAAFSSSNQLGFQGSVTADMDAGDTATFTINVNGSTKTVDIVASGSATSVYTYFSGFLAC